MQSSEHFLLLVYTLPLVLLAFALHEMAHAYTATWFGDPTPKQHGRKTLNPIRHLDPIGTVMIVVSMFVFGFPMGFAVTPVNESKMRNPRWHGAVVSLAGPVTNIILLVVSLIAFVAVLQGDVSRTLEAVLFYSAVFNAFLAVFNLLPIPPLDGARILGAFMDDHTRREWRKLDEYGIFIIVALLLFGGASFSAFVGGLTNNLLELVCGLVNCPAGLV
jgi:Zn-dependent protease